MRRRISDIVLLLGMVYLVVLLLGPFVYYAIGCDWPCPPCTTPNTWTHGCDPIACDCCSGSCCPEGKVCSNNTCCPPGDSGHGYDSFGPRCCPPGTTFTEGPGGLWSCCDSNHFPCNGNCCERDSCMRCVGSECLSRCDSTKCETCVNDSCLECRGEPDQKCCYGVCVEKCKTVDGENCSIPGGSCFAGCAVDRTDCSWMGNKIVYKGGTEKICNPRGCILTFDCSDGVKVCYESMPCKPAALPIPFFCCVGIGGGVNACQRCGELWGCYSCVLDEDQKVPHEVQNDSCS